MNSQGGRIAATLASVVTGALVGAWRVSEHPAVGAAVGACAASMLAAGLLISRKLSSSERKFAALYSWAVSEDSDVVAIEALAGRVIVGLGRSAMEGVWRGRRAARFQVRLSEGAHGKDVWIEGVFIGGKMPVVDLVPKGNRRLNARRPDPHKFGRAWKVFSADKEFATELLHDEMRSRLLTAPTPRNWVMYGARFIGVRYEAFAPNCKGTPARLDFVSDLADLVPKSAWDLLQNRWSTGSPSVVPVVSRTEYVAAHPSLPSQLPLRVSAPSAQFDSLRRIVITVVVVFALGAIVAYATT